VPLGLAPNAPVIRRYARATTALESELAEHSTPL